MAEEPTKIVENPIEETQEIGIQDAPNKEYTQRLDRDYIRFITEKAEQGVYDIQDESLREFLAWINSKLGNPKGL